MKFLVLTGTSTDDIPAIVATEDHPGGWFMINLSEVEYIEGGDNHESIIFRYKSGNSLKVVCHSSEGRDRLVKYVNRITR